ncbi:MAG TPA: hypothetical protein VMZ28_13095 [Kofleriaceae bacterium]|nr:hypothetical protein [Kofleriaceae bacterium]
MTARSRISCLLFPVSCLLFFSCARPTAPSPASSATAPAAAASLPRLPAPDFLRLIPADTPYVFAQLFPLTRDQADREVIARLAALAPLRPASLAPLPTRLRLQLALVAELGGAPSIATLAAVGIDPTAARGALYGAGTTPVLRVELSDASRAAPFIARVLARAGRFEPRTARGGQRYQASSDGWIVATRDAQLIVAAGVPPAAPAAIDLVLGTRPPARSLADTTRLAEAAADTGMTAAARPAVASIDTAAAAAALGAALPSPCAAELAQLAQLVPRVSIALHAPRGADGVTRPQVRSVFHTRDDVTAALADIQGDVPGASPDADLSAAVSLALAVDAPSLVTRLVGALDAVAARAYRCPALAPLAALATRDRVLLQALAGSALADVRGVSLFLLLEPGASLATLGAVVFLGSRRPAALLAALGARLHLPLPPVEPGAPPVEVVGSLLPLGPLHVALGERAVGLALGGHARELAETLAAPPRADVPLLFARARTAQLTALLDTMEPPEPDATLAAIDPALAAQLAAIDRHDLDRHEEIELIARATDRGLTIDVTSR